MKQISNHIALFLVKNSAAFLFVGVLIIGFGVRQVQTAGALPAEKFQVNEVFLKADVERTNGPCPLRVTFTGFISANGRGVVEYTFARSDGATSPSYKMEFLKAGTQPVTTEWTVGDASMLQSYEGWQTIRILSPVAMESSRETGGFIIECEGRNPEGPSEKKVDEKSTELTTGKTAIPPASGLASVEKDRAPLPSPGITGAPPPAEQPLSGVNEVKPQKGDIVTLRNESPIIGRELPPLQKATPRIPSCDSLSRRLQDAALDTRFDIVVDNEQPNPGHVITARVVPSSSPVRLIGNDLSIPEANGSELHAEVNITWRVIGGGGNGADLGPEGVVLPDGPSSLRTNSLSLALAPTQVVEAGTLPLPTTLTLLTASVVLQSYCGGKSITHSTGDEVRVTSDPVIVQRQVNLRALQIPTILGLFRNPDFRGNMRSLSPFTPIEGAALIVVRPGTLVGPLAPDTLLGTVDPRTIPAGDSTAGRRLVLPYLEGLNQRLLTLSRTFPSNELVQGLDIYRRSLERMRQALLSHSLDSPKIRAAEEFRELNFPFIERTTVLANVNVEDEVSSLILAGPAGRTVEIFNAPNFAPGEGVLSVTLDVPGLSAVLPNLSTFTRSWARNFPDGQVIEGGAIVRILHPPGGNLLRPFVGNFEDQISSLRLR